MLRQRGFTSIDLMAVIIIVVIGGILLVGLLIPNLRTVHPAPLPLQNSTQLRLIHQGIVLYAQGNNTWYPGLDTEGKGSPTVEDRFRILLEGNYIPKTYISPSGCMISPARGESKAVWTTGTPVTTDNYSYAMLEINPAMPAGADRLRFRRGEWRDNTNPQAVVLSDRNTGTPSSPTSIWTSGGSGWKGSVMHGDNSVSFEMTHIRPTTKYGHVSNTNDSLFESTGDDDALMIYSGTGGP